MPTQALNSRLPALLARPLRSLADAEALLLGLAAAGAGRAHCERSPATVRSLLRRLGHPEQGIPAVHIAGSKGKGTTTLLLEGILCAAGLRPLSFSSPHLERWSERIRVGGQEIETAAFVGLLDALRRTAGAALASAELAGLGFFELLTGAALLGARELGADCLLLEAGMGGRCDATNVLTPRVACITTVELEHVERLGGSLEAIAHEKAGIIKPGSRVVTGALPPAAAQAVAAAARVAGARLIRLGQELRLSVRPLTGLDGLPAQRLTISLGSEALTLDLAVAGPHLAADAALALACAQQSGLVPAPALAAAATAAFAAPELPGRCEILGRHPWLLVDTAHTPASVAALAATLRYFPARQQHLVLSLSGNRQPSLLVQLLTGASTVTVTCGEPSRTLPATELATRLPPLPTAAQLRIVEAPLQALSESQRQLEPEDLLCVAGSIYLAGIARGHLQTQQVH